ncbi:hypothetical protein [Mycobacterium sp.]|uniref:hypothetical protein n=1 Tax=Mycobacterium sp. TaxID=1785 RepID=UPI002D4F82ED|nr:hypothetical protein [Mycobacterium sp.]HZA11886.1 hypothetical protein [Mycobacterium sp.]
MKSITTATRSAQASWARRLVAAGVLAGAALSAPVVVAVADSGAPSVQAVGGHHTGPDYQSITGARVGAPSEQEVSIYGGSHKHLWVEQQLYGPGVVDVPQVDSSVHQSR